MAHFHTSKKKKPVRKRHSYIEDENGNLVQVDPIRKRRKTTLTRPHRIGIRVVERLGLKWEDEKQFGRYNADIYLPDYKISCEIDGDYWHNLPGVPEKDRRRDKILFEKYGVVTLRFWESDIYENHHKMEKKIKKAIEDIEKTRRVFASKLAKQDKEPDCF